MPAFLFTDIEGSTRLWEAHPEAMRRALAQHDTLLRGAIEAAGGHVFKTIGDAFCAAFDHPAGAVAAALEAQRALAAGDWPPETPLRVRMAVHCGPAEVRDGDYFGPPLNGVARLLAVGHGGQTLVSDVVAEAVANALPPAASLLDMGAHRLRDLALPMRILQLVHPDLPAGFPPLRSLEGRPHNLPVQLTTLVGRERELAAVLGTIGSARLVTITGAGGSGKTRLALQAAGELVPDLSDGAWLVELASVADGAHVGSAVAAALGLREEPGRTLLDTLRAWLAPRELLLVLDNCEHVLDSVAPLAADLLGACPTVRILATSREPLRVAGEIVWAAPTLSLPAADGLGIGGEAAVAAVLASEAGRLFVERAQAAGAAFRLTADNAAAVGSICRRLDGIPLAIELAAARVRALAPDAILARLDERFRLLTGGSRTALPRQQTLHAAIEWSYALLDPPERRLFARLAAFRGGWTLEAAEAVCAGGDLDAWDILDALVRLVEKSLVSVDEGDGRYRFLESLRAFAADRLTESGEAVEVAARHRACFATLVAERMADYGAGQQAPALAAVAAEHDNVRAALESALAADDGPTAVGLATDLWWFWQVRGHFSEGRAWMEAIAPLSDAPGVDPHVAARLATRLGDITLAFGDFEVAEARFADALARLRAIGDADGIAVAQNSLGNLYLRTGDFDAASTAYRDSLTTIAEYGTDPRRRVAPLCNLGLIELERGDTQAAGTHLVEALDLARGFGNAAAEAVLLWNLGAVNLVAGDGPAALEACRRSLAIRQTLDDRWGLILCVELAGWTAAAEDPSRAARLLGAAEAARAPLGTPLELFQQRLHDRAVRSCREGLGDEAFERSWAAGAATSLSEAVAAVAGVSATSAT